MTDKELQKLSRRDLLCMLIEQSKELQALREEYNEARTALQDRTIRLEKAGSIAEASLQLNGVFEAAQAACRQYTESIAELSRRQEEICAESYAEKVFDISVQSEKNYEEDLLSLYGKTPNWYVTE